MSDIQLANSANLAVIVIFITLLIKIFQLLKRRSGYKLIDTANTIIQQIMSFIIKNNQKKDLETQQEAVEHIKMINERRLLNLPAVTFYNNTIKITNLNIRSQVTTSHSHANPTNSSIINPTRMEQRIEKINYQNQIQQSNYQSPKNNNNQDQFNENNEKDIAKIQQKSISTPPAIIEGKIDVQNNQGSTITDNENLEIRDLLLYKMLYRKSLRQFHSLISMIEYIKVNKLYKNIKQKGDLYCSNQYNDLDIYSHIFQFMCYSINTLFFAVCCFAISENSTISTPIIITILVSIILSIILLKYDNKYQKIQILELQSSTEQRVWEQVVTEKDKINNEAALHPQAQVIIEPTPTPNNQLPPLSRRNIPQYPTKHPTQASIVIGSYLQNQVNISQSRNQAGYGDDNINNVKNININKIQSSTENKIFNIGCVGNSFQNSQLNRDSSKGSDFNSICAESNKQIQQQSKQKFDFKDEVQTLLNERVNNTQLLFHNFIFFLTILFGSISCYLLFNNQSNIGGSIILTWFIVILVDNFFLRILICFIHSIITYIRYKKQNNIEYRHEICQQINWELKQINVVLFDKSNKETFKSPCKQQIMANVKSPHKSSGKVNPIKQMIKESIKKITSPSKKRNYNSPNKDLQQQQDEIHLMPNDNQDETLTRNQIYNKDIRNKQDLDTQTQQDYSINNISINPIMQRVNLVRKTNRYQNQSQESLDIQEEIDINRANMTPISQNKNYMSNLNNQKENQKSKSKEFALDSHRNPHIKIYSDRNQNSLRQDSSKNGAAMFDDSADTYIDSINLQPDPYAQHNKKKKNSRKSSIGQIAPLPNTIACNNNVNTPKNEGEIHSGSLCGKKISQRSHRSKKDFHTSTEQQNKAFYKYFQKLIKKEYNSKNKIILETTQNDIRSDDNFDNTMKPLKGPVDQGFRDFSYIHNNRSVNNGCDESHLYTAGDITQMNDQSNILPTYIKHDNSLLSGDINQGMQEYVNNVIDTSDGVNVYRQSTREKNNSIENQFPNSAEHRFMKISNEPQYKIQTRNIQQQFEMKQRREQQLQNKQNIGANNEVQIGDQIKNNYLKNSTTEFNESVDNQNNKISLSEGNFYESNHMKDNNFANKLHKQSAINNLVNQPNQNQLAYTNSLSFLHNQTQNDGTMILQQQQKDLSNFFNNISDNDNSLQHNDTSPDNKKISKKKILSPIPPTEIKDQGSIINEQSSYKKEYVFQNDGEIDSEQNNIIKIRQFSNNNHILKQSFDSQQIQILGHNVTEQSISNNPSTLQIEIRNTNKNQMNLSSLYNKDISDNVLQTKSLQIQNGKIIKNALEQNNNNKENQKILSIDFDSHGYVQNYSNPNSKNSKSQQHVPLKSIVKRKDQEKLNNNSPYLEFLPQMLNNQKSELKQKEKQLKQKMKKHNKKESRELNDKMKGVIDLYGFEVQSNDQKHILVQKKSNRSVRSQDSKRTIDNDKDQDFQNENNQSILQDIHNNINNDNNQISLTSNLANTIENIDGYSINEPYIKNQRRSNVNPLMKSKKPPLSSQNNILNKNLMLKEYKQDYPYSARVNLNSIALRQTTTFDGQDMSTMENNMITQSNQDGFFERNQDFVLIRPNNKESIQFDIGNSDRQNNRIEYNDEFDFDAHFQQYREQDNSVSSFDHSHFGMRSNKKN